MNVKTEITRLATMMHNEYEAWSKVLNWETQKSCNMKKFVELPIENQNVMRYIARKMLLRDKRNTLNKIKSLVIPNYDDSYGTYKQQEDIKKLREEINQLEKWKLDINSQQSEMEKKDE